MGIQSEDNTPPVITTYDPVEGGVTCKQDQDITLQFNEAVKIASGATTANCTWSITPVWYSSGISIYLDGGQPTPQTSCADMTLEESGAAGAYRRRRRRKD